MNENLVTIPMLCKELGIGKTTAYKIIKSGKIPYGKIGRKIIIHREELEHFINKNTKKYSLPNKL